MICGGKIKKINLMVQDIYLKLPRPKRINDCNKSLQDICRWNLSKKLKCFCCLVEYDHILTWNNLQKGGFIGLAICPHMQGWFGMGLWRKWSFLSLTLINNCSYVFYNGLLQIGSTGPSHYISFGLYFKVGTLAFLIRKLWLLEKKLLRQFFVNEIGLVINSNRNRKCKFIDIWKEYLVGIFYGANNRRKCRCGAVVVSNPGNFFHF